MICEERVDEILAGIKEFEIPKIKVEYKVLDNTYSTKEDAERFVNSLSEVNFRKVINIRESLCMSVNYFKQYLLPNLVKRLEEWESMSDKEFGKRMCQERNNVGYSTPFNTFLPYIFKSKELNEFKSESFYRKKHKFFIYAYKQYLEYVIYHYRKTKKALHKVNREIKKYKNT